MSRAAKKGFTLIELLIVVAIIAILAAIAVPNFLEAQTRAKVSRVKADQRSLAVAVEAYQIDWNTPPFSPSNISTGPNSGENAVHWQKWPVVPSGVSFYPAYRFWQALTTPISYIGGPLTDPFRPVQGERTVSFQQGGSGFYAYDLMDWVAFQSKAGSQFFRSHYERAFQKGHTWITFSEGPMKAAWWTGFGRTSPLNQVGAIHTIADAPSPLYVPRVDGIYDPTNGTMSFGYIIRTNKGVITVGG
jgi:prepilin-type N-terminal cleavage/methylation domain-containing protein